MKYLTSKDLTCSYWTLTGAPHGQPPRFSFEERLIAAASAGFAGIGLHYTDYTACLDRGLSNSDLRHVMDDSGICVSEMETLTGGARMTRTHARSGAP